MTDGRRIDSTGSTEPRCCRKVSQSHYTIPVGQYKTAFHSPSSVPAEPMYIRCSIAVTVSHSPFSIFLAFPTQSPKAEAQSQKAVWTTAQL